MEKDCLVIRSRSGKGPQLCYSKDGELLMDWNKACIIRAVLKYNFPMEEYSVFKEVKNNVKKGYSPVKNS